MASTAVYEASHIKRPRRTKGESAKSTRLSSRNMSAKGRSGTATEDRMGSGVEKSNLRYETYLAAPAAAGAFLVLPLAQC